MKYFLCLVLIICFCGSSYAENNPFTQIIRDEDARTSATVINCEKVKTAARFLDGIYTGDYGDEFVEVEDGLGGVVISDPDSHGVYYVPDAERYEKALRKMAADDLDHNEFIWFFLIFPSMMLFLAGSVFFVVTKTKEEKEKIDDMRIAGICTFWGMSMILFVTACYLGYDCFLSRHNIDKGQYSPGIVRSVLKARPELVDAEFYSYSKEQIEKLIKEYAERYDNNI